MNNDLKLFRSMRGKTQDDLAAAIGVPKANISAWECHRRKIPTKHWQKMAMFFGVSLDTIRELAESMARKVVSDDENEIRDRCAWVAALPDAEWAEIASAYESGALDVYQIAKIDDIEDFRDRAILGVSKLAIPSEAKGAVIAFLSDLELMVKKNG